MESLSEDLIRATDGSALLDDTAHLFFSVCQLCNDWATSEHTTIIKNNKNHDGWISYSHLCGGHAGLQRQLNIAIGNIIRGFSTYDIIR